MAVERGYEQQTSGQAAPIGATVTPGAFGAQIGDALMGAGETVHQTKVREFEIDKRNTEDQELSDWQHNFTVHRSNMDDIVRQTREQAGPGAAGHAAGVEKANAAAKDALFGNITSRAVRRHAEAQWNEFSSRLHSSEATFETGQRVAKVVTDQQRSLDIAGNRVRRIGDLETYQAELKTAIDNNAMLNVDAATRDKLDRYAETRMGVSFIQHLQDSNPAQAKQVLDSGAFDHLDGQVLEQLRNGTAVEIRRAEAAAEHTANMAKAEIREGFATIREQHSQGIEIPAAQLAAAIKTARDMGDTSAAVEFEGMAKDNAFAKIYSGQSPLQREQRLGQLAARPRLSVDEQREKKWLEDHKGALDSQFVTDPVGFALQHAPAGTKPPAGDISDPAVVQARLAWRARASQAYGREMPLFTKAEQGQLAAIKGEGAGGEAKVLGLLDQVPIGLDRARAAQQIDGGDKVFQHLAMLSPRARQTVRAGAQALTANKQFLTPSKDEDPDVVDMIGQTENELRVALKAFEPADQEAVLTVARQYLAGVHSATNTPAAQISRGNLLLAMRVALGGSIAGDGRHLGGLDTVLGRPFVLPDNMDKTQFYAGVAAQIRKTKAYPVNPDGSVADMRYMIPVLIGPGTYRWESRDGRVIAGKDGKPFISAVGR